MKSDCRAGWDDPFRRMAAAGDDRLFETPPTAFDVEEMDVVAARRFEVCLASLDPTVGHEMPATRTSYISPRAGRLVELFTY